MTGNMAYPTQMNIDNPLDSEILSATVTDILSTSEEGTRIKVQLPLTLGIVYSVLMTLPENISITVGDDIILPFADVKRMTVNEGEKYRPVYEINPHIKNNKSTFSEWRDIQNRLQNLVNAGVSGIIIKDTYAIIHKTLENKPKTEESIEQDMLKYSTTPKKINFGMTERALKWMSTRLPELEGMMGDVYLASPVKPIDMKIDNTQENTKMSLFLNNLTQKTRTELRKKAPLDDYNLLIPAQLFGLNKTAPKYQDDLNGFNQGEQKNITIRNGSNVLSPSYIQSSSLKNNPLTYWQIMNKTLSKNFFPQKFPTIEGCEHFVLLHELGHSLQNAFGIQGAETENGVDDHGNVVRVKTPTYDMDRHREEIFADCFAILTLIVDFNERNTALSIKDYRAGTFFDVEHSSNSASYMTSPSIQKAIDTADKLLERKKEGETISLYEIAHCAAEIAQKDRYPYQNIMAGFFKQNPTDALKSNKKEWLSYLNKAKYYDALEPHIEHFKIALNNLYDARELSRKPNSQKIVKTVESLTKNVKDYALEHAIPLGEKTALLYLFRNIPDIFPQDTKERMTEVFEDSLIKSIYHTQDHQEPLPQVAGWTIASSSEFARPLNIPLINKNKEDFSKQKEVVKSFRKSLRLLDRHVAMVERYADILYDYEGKNYKEFANMKHAYNESLHMVMALSASIYETLNYIECQKYSLAEGILTDDFYNLYESLPMMIDMRNIMGRGRNDDNGKKIRLKNIRLIRSDVKKAFKFMKNAETLINPKDFSIPTTEFKEALPEPSLPLFDEPNF